MKRLLFTAILALSFTTIYAQDIIVKKDGSTIMSKVMEVQTDIIKYKKWSNQSGPTYSIKITDIFSINYKNGEKDVFNSPASTPAQTTEKTAETPQESKPTATPAEEWSEESKAYNAELIASYNKDYTIDEKYIGDRNKKAKWGICFLGVAESSKISVNDVTLSIDPRLYDKLYDSSLPASVTLFNGSNKFIYVDLAKSYHINYSSTHQLYKGEITTTVTSGKNGGGSVNLGSISSALGIGGAVGTISSGINVGGGKSSYTSTSIKNERFLIIPPHSHITIMEKFGSCIFLNNPEIKNGEIYKREYKTYAEQLIVTYSYDESFEHIYTLELKTYDRYMVGVPKLIFYDGLDKLKKRYIPDADKKIMFNTAWIKN